MQFHVRRLSAFFNIEKGETRVFQLAPTSPGAIVVTANALRNELADDDSSVARIAGGSGAGPSAVAWGGADSGFAGGNEGLSPATDAALIRDENDPFNPGGGGILEPGEPGSWQASDLTIQLLTGEQVRASGISHILYDALFGAEIWLLRVTKKAESLEGRSYRIDLQYPTVLPVLERRIPMAFFHQAFEQNWNAGQQLYPEHQYLESFELSGNKLRYRLDPKFAALYEMEQEPAPIDLDIDDVTFPRMYKDGNVIFFAGPVAVPTPDHPEDPAGEPYFGVRITCRVEEPRELDVPANSNIPITDPMWLELRFYLYQNAGRVWHRASVHSSLLTDLDESVWDPSWLDPFNTTNVKDKFEAKILEKLREILPPGSLDRLRPWLVGDYDLEYLRYDRTTDSLMVGYVGRPTPITSVGDANTGVVGAEVSPTEWTGGGGGGGLAGGPLGDIFIGTGNTGGVLADPGPVAEPIIPVPLFDWSKELPPRLSAEEGEDVPVYGSTKGSLAKIEHIVVLMQENRSFDQVLGYLSRDKGMINVDGLLPGDNSRDFVGTELYGEFRSLKAAGTDWPFDVPNPCHDRDCVEGQIASGMKGFIPNYIERLSNSGDLTHANVQRIMDYYGEGQLPAYDALVRDFAICDRWFCSHLGPTLPNRFITLTGDFNRNRYGEWEVGNAPISKDFAPSVRKSIFDVLTARNVSWKAYEHGYGFLRLFRNYTFDNERVVGFRDPLRGFLADCQRGSAQGGLPQVSFIEPDYIEAPDGNDDHAPADMMNGQRLIAAIVKGLVESDVWEKTLLIITYDEHGGFYDHVFPPEGIEVAAADGTTSIQPIPTLSNGARRLGVRVPAFVVSPLISRKPDVNVSHTVFDHTTIPATILRTFCSPNVPKLSIRADSAHDLRDLLDLETPRPKHEFNELVAALNHVLATAPASSPRETPPRALQTPIPNGPADDFHGLIALAGSITGMRP